MGCEKVLMSFPRSSPTSKHWATPRVNDCCLCIFIFIIILLCVFFFIFFGQQHCPLVFRFPFVIKRVFSVTFHFFSRHFCCCEVCPGSVTVGGGRWAWHYIENASRGESRLMKLYQSGRSATPKRPCAWQLANDICFFQLFIFSLSGIWMFRLPECNLQLLSLRIGLQPRRTATATATATARFRF